MASHASKRLARDILGARGNMTFESLGETVDFVRIVTNYSPVIDSDVNDNLPQIVTAADGKTLYDLKSEMFVRKTACTKLKMGE